MINLFIIYKIMLYNKKNKMVKIIIINFYKPYQDINKNWIVDLELTQSKMDKISWINMEEESWIDNEFFDR